MNELLFFLQNFGKGLHFTSSESIYFCGKFCQVEYSVLNNALFNLAKNVGSEYINEPIFFKIQYLCGPSFISIHHSTPNRKNKKKTLSRLVYFMMFYLLVSLVNIYSIARWWMNV